MKRWKHKGGKRHVHRDGQGRRVKSGFEVKVSNALGKGWDYEALKLPYVLENVYNPDFSSIRGAGIFIEAKGRFTGADRRKMLAVKKAHPGADIRLVFMRAGNKLYKGSKTTYGDWATTHGFRWSQFPRLPL